jgi:hypothetical protein
LKSFRFRPPRRPAVLLSSGLVALAAALGGIAAAGAATSSPTFYACVNLHAKPYTVVPWRGIWYLKETQHSCPAGSFAISWNQAGPQGPAGPATLSVTATTAVSNRDDSGGHGNWALDTFTRVVTVTRHSAVDVSHCGQGAVICYYYTASLADNGTFATVAGALSPNAGTAISGSVQGSMTGGSKIEFYAGSADGSWDGAPSATAVPATVTGDTPATTTWVEQFFPSSTVFTSPQLLNWSWTYSAPNTCEQWVDAYNNGDGAQPADGDITGVNACTA